jgi:hypothetical protein
MENVFRRLVVMCGLLCVCPNLHAVDQGGPVHDVEQPTLNTRFNELVSAKVKKVSLDDEGTFYKLDGVKQVFDELINSFPRGINGALQLSLRNNIVSRLENGRCMDGKYIKHDSVYDIKSGLEKIDNQLSKFRGMDSSVFASVGDFVVDGEWKLNGKVFFTLTPDNGVSRVDIGSFPVVTSAQYEGLDLNDLLTRGQSFKQWLSTTKKSIQDGEETFYDVSSVSSAIQSLIKSCISDDMNSPLSKSVVEKIDSVLRPNKHSGSTTSLKDYYRLDSSGDEAVGTGVIRKCFEVLEIAYNGVQKIEKAGVKRIVSKLVLGEDGDLMLPVDKEIAPVSNELSVRSSVHNLIETMMRVDNTVHSLEQILTASDKSLNGNK